MLTMTTTVIYIKEKGKKKDKKVSAYFEKN